MLCQREHTLVSTDRIKIPLDLENGYTDEMHFGCHARWSSSGASAQWQTFRWKADLLEPTEKLYCKYLVWEDVVVVHSGGWGGQCRVFEFFVRSPEEVLNTCKRATCCVVSDIRVLCLQP